MSVIKKYLHHIDLVRNKLMNPLLNPMTSVERTALGASLTTADEGYTTFDTTLNNIYFWTGSTWIAPSGGGGAVWGGITGTLTAQTDLTAYLAANYYPLSSNPAGYIDLTDLSGGTGISYNNLTGVITNSLPDQTVALTAGTGINVSGTYPNFTITNSSPSSGGTVTGVTATSPITSSGGTAPVISTSMATNKLIGRSTVGVGVMEEITVGTGLTLSAGTLSSTVTGGIPHGIAAGTDTYTVTIAGVTSYAEGDAYIVRFTNGNTTSCTLNINGLGAITLYRNNNGVLIGGDIIDNGDMLCVYDVSLPGFRVIGTAPNTLLGYVTNADSVTITKGQVVYAFGGTGDRMTVKLANNTGDATSAQTVGVVLSTSIAANQKGFIIVQGLLDGLSILPTATYTDGDSVYLGTTPGSITNVKPYAPAHLVYVGTVTTASNGSSGRMYVKIQNGYELDELHNVQAQSPSLNDTLYYDSGVTPGQWKTASISTILGYTPVNPTRNIGTTAPLAGGGDLSSDRTLSITQSTTSTDGYLSSTDWNTFNGKIGSDATLLGYNDLGSAIKAYPLGINLTAVGGSATFVDGRLWLTPVYIGADGTITGVRWYQVIIGAYTADNYNGVGLYSISGGTLTLVASSTDDGNIWKTTGATWGIKAFTTPYTATRGTYYIGALINSSTAITGSVGAVTIGAATLTGFDFTASRMYCYLGAQLSLPASIALSGTTSLGTSALYFSLY